MGFIVFSCVIMVNRKNDVEIYVKNYGIRKKRQFFQCTLPPWMGGRYMFVCLFIFFCFICFVLFCFFS